MRRLTSQNKSSLVKNDVALFTMAHASGNAASEPQNSRHGDQSLPVLWWLLGQHGVAF